MLDIAIQLQQKYDEFRTFLENNPGDEIPQVLEEIDALVLKALLDEGPLPKDYLERRSKIEDFSREYLGKTINVSKSIEDLLDELSERVYGILKLFPEEIDKEMNILVKQLDGVILPPGDGKYGEGDGEEESREETILEESRYGKILEILRNNSIYADDIIVYSGTVKKAQARETSYRVIQIPSLGKTIFTCDEYGEASFVVDSLVYPEVFLENTKLDIREGLDAQRVAHSVGWEERIQEAIFGKQDSTDLKQESVRRISVREMDEYREEILRQFPTPNDYLKRRGQTRQSVLAFGKTPLVLYNMLFGSKVRKVVSLKQYAKLGVFFYGVGFDILDCEDWSIDTWKKNIKEKYPSGESLMSKRGEPEGFEIAGKRLTYIHKLLVGESGSPVGEPQDRARVLRIIYGELDCFNIPFWKKEDFSKEIKRLFPDPGTIIKLPFINRKRSGRKESSEIVSKEDLRIGPYGFHRIASDFYDFEGNVFESNAKLSEFLIQVYGTGYDILDCFDWNWNNWKEHIRKQYTYDELVALPVAAFRKKRVLNRVFNDLSTTYCDTTLNVMNRTHINDFLSMIYN